MLIDHFIYVCYRSPDKNYKVQRLLLGTHTNDDEPNYVQIASVKIPILKAEDTPAEDTSGNFCCQSILYAFSNVYI